MLLTVFTLSLQLQNHYSCNVILVILSSGRNLGTLKRLCFGIVIFLTMRVLCFNHFIFQPQKTFEMKVNISGTELVVLENVKSVDTHAVVLKVYSFGLLRSFLPNWSQRIIRSKVCPNKSVILVFQKWNKSRGSCFWRRYDHFDMLLFPANLESWIKFLKRNMRSMSSIQTIGKK